MRRRKERNLRLCLGNLRASQLEKRVKKQCEMYFKWRIMIPEQYREALCPRPSDEATERHRRYKEERRQMRNNMLRDRLEELETGRAAESLEFLNNDE